MYPFNITGNIFDSNTILAPFRPTDCIVNTLFDALLKLSYVIKSLKTLPLGYFSSVKDMKCQNKLINFVSIIRKVILHYNYNITLESHNF